MKIIISVILGLLLLGCDEESQPSKPKKEIPGRLFFCEPSTKEAWVGEYNGSSARTGVSYITYRVPGSDAYCKTILKE